MWTEIVKMQKFIVANNRNKSDPNNNDQTTTGNKKLSPLNGAGNMTTAAAPTQQATATDHKVTVQSASPIKMSGYLKKKRSRALGWGKLWFVLQNQLMLSYSSKEDYEKRLAPFKDVINLVPGTIIKPAPGSRFTLETTTSSVIYIFRCDDNKSCSEWITAICESLGIKGRQSFQSLTSQKWSLNRQPVRQGAKIPKLPIAKNTARIIERGLKIEHIDHISKVQQDFRLHQAEFVLSQSCDVSRINRMFIVDGGGGVKKERNNSQTVNHQKQGKDCRGGGGKVLVSSYNFPAGKMETLNECEIEEQMQCITLEDTSLLSERDAFEEVDDDKKKQPEDADLAIVADKTRNLQNGNNNGDDLAVSSASSCTITEPIYAVVDLKHKYERRAILNKQQGNLNGLSEADDEDDKPATRVNTITSTTNANSVVVHKTDDEDNDAVDGNGDSSGSGSSYHHQGRPKSFQLFSSDYEEVGNFPDLVFSEPNSSEEKIYEPINIPEELLARETHKNVWRYFPKINLAELTKRRHHLHHNIITKSAEHHDLMRSGREPVIPPRSKVSPNSSTTSSSCNSTTSSSFSEMRRKWGSHRKSIKNRVKKMYTKSGESPAKKEVSKSCELPVIEDADRVLPFFNNCLTKRDKTLFGSLSRLRKSRTSICIEEIGPKQKNFFAQNHHRMTNRKVAENPFQKELQREMDKRVGVADCSVPEKSVCHSKFYN